MGRNPRTRRLQNEAGAADPMLIIAAIAASLILILGGGFVISGIIAQGKEQAARNDLSSIAATEASVRSAATRFWGYDSHDDSDRRKLERPGFGIGFTASEGVRVIVDVDDTGTGWIAVSRAETGKTYARSSENDVVAELPTELARLNLPGGIEADVVTNMLDALDADSVYDFGHAGQRNLSDIGGLG